MTTKRFEYLKGNCKVCNGARPDCRKSKSTGLIHCLHSEPNLIDYIFRGEDRQGFGMWAERAEVEARSKATPQQREEWQRQREKERQQRLEAERTQRSQLLSEPERDREIRKLLAQLDLSPQHREDLHRRGLSDEQIKAGMFRSVVQWQKLETEISPRLAGVNIDGRSLNNYYSGYLCPVWNPHGQIIGWQLRSNNTDDSKYRWPSSNSEKRPNGGTAHLTNGELPLTCCRPLGETDKGLFLAEGILKPQIIAQLSGYITLGAAGGNFASSPLIFKAFLADLESEIAGQRQPIALCPDAGAVGNKSVMRQHRATYSFLKQLGYEVEVMWWHQINKNDLDLDEMLAAGRHDEIGQISWKEFEAIANDIAEDEAITREPIPFLRKGIVGFIQKLAKSIGFKKTPEPTTPKSTSSEATSEPEPNPTPQEPNPEPNSKSMDYWVYAPGRLPSPEEYIAWGCPRIKFKDGQRQALWREAVKKGFRHILDLSPPGTGKSHTAGISRPQNFGAEKLVYLAANHRNPTTLPIEENYKDLPVRNAGMVFDKSRKTPMGYSHVVWTKKGEEGITVGNCNRQGLFEVFRKKNISVEGEENPICKNCHLRGACSSDTGEGFGFKFERHEVLKESLIRAHPSSVPNPNDALMDDDKDKEDEFDLSTAGAIWDEPDSLINPIQQITVKLADLDQIMGLIEGKLPAVHKALTKVRLILRQLLNKEIKESRYGFDDAAMRKILPHRQQNLKDIISELERELEPDLSPLNSTEEYGVDMKDLPDHVKKRFREKPIKLIQELEKSIALNWLVPFLKIWNKQEPGALQCQYGELTIYTRDYRHVEIAAASKFNIYLDATIRPDDLALRLNIKPENILVIEQNIRSHNNLQVVHVIGMGQLGKDRSDSLIARVDALKDELKSRHGETFKIIDWKACASDDEQNWFKDSRGSNDFETCQAMASFGIPYKNVGHLQGIYQSLTGCYISLNKKESDPAFQAFVDTQIEAEIIQAVGRLRAERRPNEQLTYYFVGDYNLSFLDLPVEQIEAHIITLEAGDKPQQTWCMLVEAIKQTAEAGKKLTQSVLAEAAGITQGRVSQLMKEIGGWKVLQKILMALLNPSDSAINNLSDLTEMEIQMARDYLPSLLDSSPEDVPDMDSTTDKVKEVVEVADVFPDTFDSILAALPLKAKSKLFNLLVWLMPGEVQQEIGVILSSG